LVNGADIPYSLFIKLKIDNELKAVPGILQRVERKVLNGSANSLQLPQEKKSVSSSVINHFITLMHMGHGLIINYVITVLQP